MSSKYKIVIEDSITSEEVIELLRELVISDLNGRVLTEEEFNTMKSSRPKLSQYVVIVEEDS